MQRWNTGAYGWELTGISDDKLTFREAESDASEPGSSSFEYLTSATHPTYISLRRCNPGVPEDVRILERGVSGRHRPLFSLLHLPSLFWNHVSTAVATRLLICTTIRSLYLREGWKGTSHQGILRSAAARPHQQLGRFSLHLALLVQLQSTYPGVVPSDRIVTFSSLAAYGQHSWNVRLSRERVLFF